MGCASSNPLLQSGKNLIENAKDTASEFANKGEHVVQDVSDSTKEGIVHVKDAMGSALHTAENSIGNVVGKISDTFTNTKSEVKETVEDLEEATEKTMTKANDTMVEAVSEAETVLASEAENAKEFMSDTKNSLTNAVDDLNEDVHGMKEKAFGKMDTMKSQVKSGADELKNEAEDALKIEDMEQSLESIENDVEKKADEIVKRLPTPAPSPPPEVEAKKEDPPTFWEAAADAILEKRMQSLDVEVPESVPEQEIRFNNHNHPEGDLELEDLEIEEIDRPRAEDHLGEPCGKSDKISMSSFILKDE